MARRKGRHDGKDDRRQVYSRIQTGWLTCYYREEERQASRVARRDKVESGGGGGSECCVVDEAVQHSDIQSWSNKSQYFRVPEQDMIIGVVRGRKGDRRESK